MAVAGVVPLDVLSHAAPPFPTFSEAWLRLLETHTGCSVPSGSLQHALYPGADAANELVDTGRIERRRAGAVADRQGALHQ
jgi:hypothetical protein